MPAAADVSSATPGAHVRRARCTKTRPTPRCAAPKLATVTLLDADDGAVGTTVALRALEYTRALSLESVGDAATTTAVRVCEHFDRHGQCNRGHRCRFAHVRKPHDTTRASTAMATATSVKTLSASTPAVAASTTSSGPSRPPSIRVAASPSSKVPRGAAVGCDKVQTSRGWRHAAYGATPRFKPL